jgi:hypothetical protein
VRQPGDKAQADEGPEPGRQGTGQIAQREHQHQADQQLPFGHLRRQCGNQRGAHHHAQGVAADRVADLLRRHRQIAGDAVHQPHDHEFGGADGETAQRQGELGKTGV